MLVAKYPVAIFGILELKRLVKEVQTHDCVYQGTPSEECTAVSAQYATCQYVNRPRHGRASRGYLLYTSTGNCQYNRTSICPNQDTPRQDAGR